MVRMEKQKQVTVFLSHTKADKPFSKRLAHDLETFGAHVWLDEWELRVGDSIMERVQQGIDNCQWMVVVLSSAALQSAWVKKELQAGLTRETSTGKVFVLPALCEEVALPAFLRDKFYADFAQAYHEGFRLIRDRVFGIYLRRPWEEPSCGLPRSLPLGAQLGEGHVKKMRVIGREVEKFEFTPIPILYPTRVDHLYVHTLLGRLEQSHPEAPAGAQLWFGDSGRLFLWEEHGTVLGEYDWHGYQLSGGIHGKPRGKTIVFDWWWDLSSEKGKGVFWTDAPGVLYGGWWMDFDDIEVEAVLSRKSHVPHDWSFVSLRTTRVDPAT